MVKRINIVFAEVADMERSAAFYRDLLGLEPGTASPYWSDFRVGESKMGLHPPFKDPPSAGNGWILGLEVDDLKALRLTLEGAGVTCAEYHDVPSGCVMEFADPDGHLIQAIQPNVTAEELR